VQGCKCRGDFFQAVCRIEQLLGKAYGDVDPYPLFAPDEYLSIPVGRRLRFDRSESGDDEIHAA
jgi:hypothetical protein